MDKLKELLSRCKAAVSITVNDHRNVYESVETYLHDREGWECPPEIEPDVRAKMIETDTVIEVQFYPDTPVGFYSVYHYDLDAALDEALACLNS